MKQIRSILIIITLLFMPMLLNASPLKSTLPSDAFWIKNHWSEINGYAQVPPVNWRAIVSFEDWEKRINKEGLDNLFISGSASPSIGFIRWFKKTYGQEHPLYIIDLRQETHLLVNGLPISIFYKRDEINWGKSLQEIEETEKTLVRQLLSNHLLQINHLGKPQNGFKVPINPENLIVKEATTEQSATEQEGVHYFRITVPDYHPPSPAQVDQFLTLMSKIPNKSWLHFHCAAGKGRTTTFMVMRDILANGKKVTLQDIVYRQAMLGGINLLSPSKSWVTQPWKKEYHTARMEFITLFYHYIHNGNFPKQSFSQWLTQQPESTYKLLLKTAAYKQ